MLVRKKGRKLVGSYVTAATAVTHAKRKGTGRMYVSKVGI